VTVPGRLASARLYAITPDLAASRIEDLAQAWIAGGVDVLQLRAPSLPRGVFLDLGRRLRLACAGAGCLFVINDYLDLALICDADGVHLGQSDLSLDAARRLAGSDFLIGASASTAVEGQRAEQAGADYLGSGPTYPTPLKPDKPVIGPGGVLGVQRAVGIPVFAIGGINRSRILELRAAGVERVCVLRALADATDSQREATLLRQSLL
jgi:thiamine-phosphate pyrophosphorylase